MQNLSKISARACTKLILCGEHSVVYGGKAVAIPIGVFNDIEMQVARRDSKTPKISFYYKNLERDCGMVSELLIQGKKFVESGDSYYFLFTRVAQFVLEKNNLDLTDELEFHLLQRGSKGMGNSSSFGAGIAAVLLSYFGISFDGEKLFEASQFGDLFITGGKASGIDAKTICSGAAQNFSKTFLPDGTVGYDFEKLVVSLPRNTKLLIAIPVLPPGKNPQDTGELVALFAKNNNITKKPGELSEEERKKITGPFDSVVERIEKELNGNGDAVLLGKLFNENHALLKKAGVSSQNIETAIEISLKNGALGAKLTGAGGDGGAVIVLAREENAEAILNNLEKQSFKVLEAEIAEKGVEVL